MSSPAVVGDRGILDTGVVIGTEVAPIPAVLAISTMSLAEQQFGVLIAATPEARAERLRRLSLLQLRFRARGVDEVVAVRYGRLASADVESGRQSRMMDLLIAATAHTHGATFFTRNPEDYIGLELAAG